MDLCYECLLFRICHWGKANSRRGALDLWHCAKPKLFFIIINIALVTVQRWVVSAHLQMTLWRWAAFVMILVSGFLAALSNSRAQPRDLRFHEQIPPAAAVWAGGIWRNWLFQQRVQSSSTGIRTACLWTGKTPQVVTYQKDTEHSLSFRTSLSPAGTGWCILKRLGDFGQKFFWNNSGEYISPDELKQKPPKQPEKANQMLFSFFFIWTFKISFVQSYWRLWICFFWQGRGQRTWTQTHERRILIFNTNLKYYQAQSNLLNGDCRIEIGFLDLQLSRLHLCRWEQLWFAPAPKWTLKSKYFHGAVQTKGVLVGEQKLFRCSFRKAGWWFSYWDTKPLGTDSTHLWGTDWGGWLTSAHTSPAHCGTPLGAADSSIPRAPEDWSRWRICGICGIRRKAGVAVGLTVGNIPGVLPVSQGCPVWVNGRLKEYHVGEEELAALEVSKKIKASSYPKLLEFAVLQEKEYAWILPR